MTDEKRPCLCPGCGSHGGKARYIADEPMRNRKTRLMVCETCDHAWIQHEYGAGAGAVFTDWSK